MGTRLPLPSETHVRVGVGEKILSAEGFTLAELANLDPFQLEMVKCMDMHLWGGYMLVSKTI